MPQPVLPTGRNAISTVPHNPLLWKIGTRTLVMVEVSPGGAFQCVAWSPISRIRLPFARRTAAERISGLRSTTALTDDMTEAVSPRIMADEDWSATASQRVAR